MIVIKNYACRNNANIRCSSLLLSNIVFTTIGEIGRETKIKKDLRRTHICHTRRQEKRITN